MSISQNKLQGWMVHRRALTNLLELIENEHTHYKPWESAFSFGEQFLHTALTSHNFVAGLKEGYIEKPDQMPAFETMDDVRRIFHEFTDKTIAVLQEISDEDLEREVQFINMKQLGKSWVHVMIDHEVHHKGQMFVYARLVGIEKLPFFISTPAT
ncbi:DinB family protein [Brevibacillus daliensis]|uniref:DinB family protein n=1 Tax=Brevibacillus daliensis TaxID=2892995 RepID=UPI001E519042|nr:DinB family protein [Brevibacillus daliensis]